MPFAKVPDIRTELPGPAAREIIADDAQYLSPSYARPYPLVAAGGEGAAVEDVDGNVFLDFTAGIAVCATGHCHPRIVQAVREQAGRLIHMSGTDFYYPQQRDLARRLAEMAPGDSNKRVFFTNSGTEAVEAALKLARYHTGRHRAIAFSGAFHGRTLGALSLTGSKAVQRRGFGPLLSGVSHVPYPDCFRCPEKSADGGCCRRSIRMLEDDLFRRTVPPDDVAAIVVEPIQGEGGYIVPPPEFHRELKRLAAEHGILYVADEVQSGMGRTGRMFAVEHWDIEPDILCLAKGIASGMPLGAMVARSEIMNWPPGSHASTFGGNPVCCAAALETINLLEEELIDNAAEVGGFLIDRLEKLKTQHGLIGEVRGKGLMIGLELVRDQRTRQRAVEERDFVIQQCFEKGLLVLPCGENVVRLAPPLIIGAQEAETAVGILGEALSEAARQ